jgi:hypothetical protein
MDILAHFLWTLAIYWQHPRRWIAGLIGFLPDILSFGIFFVQRIITGNFERGAPQLATIPTYVFTLYDLTHSIVVFAIGAALLWFFARDWFWLSLGWGLHIIIDVPTHTNRFFPTPVFWPISDVTFSGIGWGSWWFMLMNYAALAAVYTYLVWKVPRTG